MSLQNYYVDGITIQRNSKTGNGIGSKSSNWITHLNILGLIDQLSGNEKNVAAKFASMTTNILFTDAGQDITDADRVLYKSKIYRILNVDNPMNMDRHLEILLEYIGVDQ